MVLIDERHFWGMIWQVVLFFGVIIAIIFFLYIIYRLWNDLLIIFFPFALAVMVTYLLNPVITLLEYHKIPRHLGILLIYTLFFGFIIIVAVHLVPSLLQDIQELMEKLPEYSERFRIFIERIHYDYERFNLPESLERVIDENIQEIQQRLVLNLERVSELIVIIFSHMFSLILVPILAYYFLRDEALLKRYINKLIPRQYSPWILTVLSEMDKVLGAYLRGMVTISAAVGAMTYLGLLLLDVDFALILGVISGVTNFIPYFGPLIGAIPAILVAFLSSPALALQVIILIIVIQQIESQLIAPQILGRSLGFHPLTIIFLLLLGGRLAGFIGLLVVVPLAAFLKIILQTMWPEIFNFEG